MSLPAIDPFRTVHTSLKRFFKNESILQLFDRYATYNGSNPYQAPATLNIIPYVEYGLGGYYVRGGMFRIVEALEQVARQSGVEIQLNARVTSIKHRDGQITGVVVNGDQVQVNRVLCNADVVTTFNDLIEGLPRRRKQLNAFEPSLSGMVFLWGVKSTFPRMKHHNIFFSSDYEQEFEQIFKQKQPPDDPTIYVAITSRVDASDAPPGCENWFVLLNMPYLAANQDWDSAVNSMREKVLEKLKQHGLDVGPHISCEKVLTPEYFYQKYGSNCGSIYGISSNSRTMAFQRPANRSRDLRGLYFAGGACHPGGGIPLVLLSGKMAAELLIENEQ
jgi:phytoene desaturase